MPATARPLRSARKWLLGAIFALLLPSFAQAEMTLNAVLEHAWARAVSARVAESGQLAAQASQAVARSWLAHAPALTYAEQSDRFNQNRGEREREIELALPLWLPGQREARQQVAEGDTAHAEAAIAAARLALAGEVRTAIWTLASRLSALDMASEHLAMLDKLEAQMARRHRAGELARVDHLLAREETLAAKSRLAQAQAQAAEAQAHYRMLSGLDQLPALVEESPAPAPPALPLHAGLRLAQVAVEQAHAALQLARESRREAPELALGLLQSRDTFTTPNAHSVRLAIRFPLASETRNAPMLATAHAGLIHAEAKWRAVMAEVDAQQHSADADLASAEAQLAAATERAALATERLTLLQKAFALGELGLSEFMRVHAAATQARLEQARATYARAAARARVNQSRGILP